MTRNNLFTRHHDIEYHDGYVGSVINAPVLANEEEAYLEGYVQGCNAKEYYANYDNLLLVQGELFPDE